MNKETSRAYIVSNIKLRNEIYGNWKEFCSILNSGPDSVKKYLSNMWNSISKKDIAEGIELIDLERKIDENSFNITMNKVNNITIFYFIFPDSDFFMAQAKCVALALMPTLPRYFTMEVAIDISTSRRYYVMGEWKLINGKFNHINYGEIPNGTIENFSYHVLDVINKK